MQIVILCIVVTAVTRYEYERQSKKKRTIESKIQQENSLLLIRLRYMILLTSIFRCPCSAQVFFVSLFISFRSFWLFIHLHVRSLFDFYVCLFSLRFLFSSDFLFRLHKIIFEIHFRNIFSAKIY